MYVFAQQPAKTEYHKIDNSITIIPAKQTIDPVQLVGDLTAGLPDSTDRARALYTWIAKNISYDVATFRSSNKRTQSVEEVLKTRKAICTGYSLLFQRFCEIAGIKASVIEGYAKGFGYEPFQKFLSTNHAWNAVFIGGKWHFIDVTWAAGVPAEISGHRQVIDLDAYFFISPEKLIKTHLPEDPIWQLQDKKITLADFETGITEPQSSDVAILETPATSIPVDEFERDIIKYKRSLNFNPRNESLRMQLSFAYAYKAISITDGIWKLSYTTLTDTLQGIGELFIAYLDSAQTTMAAAINTKNRDIINDEANYQKGVFNYELAANLFQKAQKHHGLQPTDRTIIDALFTEAEKHFVNVPPESIYAQDAKKYLGNIEEYRSAKKD